MAASPGGNALGCEISLSQSPVLVHDIRAMQTLNVGAGRTDQEYAAAEEQRREELRSDVQTYAMYFFIAAGLAGLGTGLLVFKLNIIANIGAIDLLAIYGSDLLQGNILYFRAVAAAWVLLLVVLGLAARKGQRWAFWTGAILYAADLPCVMIMLNLWTILAVGVHGFFIMQWFKGQKAVGELQESSAEASSSSAWIPGLAVLAWNDGASLLLRFNATD